MIPIPPTSAQSRDTRQQDCHDLAGRELCLNHIFWTADVEVFRFARVDVMPLTKKARDLRVASGHGFSRTAERKMSSSQ